MLKNKKILLDLDDEDEPMNVGFLRLTKRLPDYEMFFEINKINSFNFSRIEDLNVKKFFYARFEAHHPETKSCYNIVANKSIPKKKNTSNELFAQAEEIKFLMPKNKDIDYIIYAKDSFQDFSLILLPENILFQIQEYSLQPNSELYKLIHYYE